MAEEENLSLEESGGPMERGSRRRTPKEEPKLSEVRVCVCVNLNVLVRMSVLYSPNVLSTD